MGVYSNGYNLSAVTTALKTRLGFRQPLLTGSPVLSAGVKQSDSGRHYQDFHSLVTVANIKAVMEQVNASDADLNTYLDELEAASIMRVLNGVFAAPEYIEQVRLFRRHGQSDEPISNSGLFCGYEIDIAHRFDCGVQIDAVHLYFNGAATFNLYLFKDGKVTTEWTESVTTVANELTVKVITDRVLGPGKYYLGYFQNDIGATKAIREQVEAWEKTCLFRAVPMSAASTGATTFSRDERSQGFDTYGLNLDMSSFKDHTLQIQRKAAAFDELIGLQMAYNVIEQIVYAVRSNATERILKDQLYRIGIQLDLNGTAPISESPKVMGLKQRIERETDKVRKQFYPNPKSQTVTLEC